MAKSLSKYKPSVCFLEMGRDLMSSFFNSLIFLYITIGFLGIQWKFGTYFFRPDIERDITQLYIIFIIIITKYLMSKRLLNIKIDLSQYSPISSAITSLK